MKKFLSILLSLISVVCIAFAFGGCSDKTTTYTELSEEDLKSLQYYREGTLEDDFQDNSVYVI